MPEEARKKRYEWLDVLKFMGMLEIYIAHMGTVSGKLLPLMFVFNVQLFFFMSGLFYRPPQKGQLRGYLVPYFLFSFIIMGLSFIRHDFELSKFKFLAKCLTWVPYIQQLGRDSLILCGCEDSTRVLVNDFISIFGLSIVIQTPLASVLCALLYLVVCGKIYGTLARRFFPILVGKWRPGQPVLQRKNDTAHRFTEI